MDVARHAPSNTQIYHTRKKFGLTQKEAAYLIHCNSFTWSQWEAGRNRMHLAFWELFNIKVRQYTGCTDHFWLKDNQNLDSHLLFSSRLEALQFMLAEMDIDLNRKEDNKLDTVKAEKYLASNTRWHLNLITLSKDGQNILFINDQIWEDYVLERLNISPEQPEFQTLTNYIINGNGVTEAKCLISKIS